MRILTGTLKGKILDTSLKGRKVVYRPTSSKTKLAIFNIIHSHQHDLGRVMDVCCGSGAVGFEALSNGAESILFIDAERAQIELVKNNAAKLHVVPYCHFLHQDALKLNILEKFDTIFFDPPYHDQKLFHHALTILTSFLSPGGWLIAEHGLKQDAQTSAFISKRYGNTKLSIWVKEE